MSTKEKMIGINIRFRERTAVYITATIEALASLANRLFEQRDTATNAPPTIR